MSCEYLRRGGVSKVFSFARRRLLYSAPPLFEGDDLPSSNGGRLQIDLLKGKAMPNFLEGSGTNSGSGDRNIPQESCERCFRRKSARCVHAGCLGVVERARKLRADHIRPAHLMDESSYCVQQEVDSKSQVERKAFRMRQRAV